MPTCQNCGSEYEASELTRHVVEEWLIVHCPDCHAPMGRYRSSQPAVDTMQESE
ncbi:hypothetical protein [Haloferax mucosum]|uniref:hypothetical protein n=1 Tax=Haloferax mucosum TaxID=403181 RepID=UPI0003261731|nr:hypothetical protein [Haloferax mucosum]